MQDSYLELKIEEVRIEKPFFEMFKNECLNGCVTTQKWIW